MNFLTRIRFALIRLIAGHDAIAINWTLGGPLTAAPHASALIQNCAFLRSGIDADSTSHVSAEYNVFADSGVVYHRTNTAK